MIITQQDFLRAAMKKMEMRRAAFAERIGCSVRALDKWLLPPSSKDHRTMDETIWVSIREILAHDKLKAKVLKDQVLKAKSESLSNS